MPADERPPMIDPSPGRHSVLTSSAASAVPSLGAVSDALNTFRGFLQHDWVVNSRGRADEQVIPTVASMAGFTPRIGHRADSLDLVQDIITAGLAVGLLPAPDRPGRHPAPADRPEVVLRAFAVSRRGRQHWAPPLALVLRLLTQD